MENKKIETQIPALEDEALDQAAGGGGNELRYCSLCGVRSLITPSERSSGICGYCRSNTYHGAR